MPNYPWLQTNFKRIYDSAQAGRLPHALLLSGAEGTGVPEFAAEIAAYRLCFQGSESGACGQCKACSLLNSGTHPDLKRLEPENKARNIKVDQVRALVDFMSQTPQIGDWKVAIIQPAHLMNINASNALLKVLEEPPGSSLLLLATERPQVLLPTVRSRCMQMMLSGPNAQQSQGYLEAAGMEADAGASAIKMLGNKPLMIAEWFHSDLMPSWQRVIKELAALESRQSNAVQAAQAMKDQDILQVVSWLLQYVSAKMKAAYLSDPVDQQCFTDYERVYVSLLDARQTLDAGANPNPQLTLESIFLDWPNGAAP